MKLTFKPYTQTSALKNNLDFIYQFDGTMRLWVSPSAGWRPPWYPPRAARWAPHSPQHRSPRWSPASGEARRCGLWMARRSLWNHLGRCSLSWCIQCIPFRTQTWQRENPSFNGGYQWEKTSRNGGFVHCSLWHFVAGNFFDENRCIVGELVLWLPTA